MHAPRDRRVDVRTPEDVMAPSVGSRATHRLDTCRQPAVPPSILGAAGLGRQPCPGAGIRTGSDQAHAARCGGPRGCPRLAGFAPSPPCTAGRQAPDRSPGARAACGIERVGSTGRRPSRRLAMSSRPYNRRRRPWARSSRPAGRRPPSRSTRTHSASPRPACRRLRLALTRLTACTALATTEPSSRVTSAAASDASQRLGPPMLGSRAGCGG